MKTKYIFKNVECVFSVQYLSCTCKHSILELLQFYAEGICSVRYITLLSLNNIVNNNYH